MKEQTIEHRSAQHVTKTSIYQESRVKAATYRSDVKETQHEAGGKTTNNDGTYDKNQENKKRTYTKSYSS
jgi:hypothetical protein